MAGLFYRSPDLRRISLKSAAESFGYAYHKQATSPQMVGLANELTKVYFNKPLVVHTAEYAPKAMMSSFNPTIYSDAHEVKVCSTSLLITEPTASTPGESAGGSNPVPFVSGTVENQDSFNLAECYVLKSYHWFLIYRHVFDS